VRVRHCLQFALGLCVGACFYQAPPLYRPACAGAVCADPTSDSAPGDPEPLDARHADGSQHQDSHTTADAGRPTDATHLFLDWDSGDGFFVADVNVCSADCGVPGTTNCGPDCTYCCKASLCDLSLPCR
jgi:hypothetical protein